MEHRGTRTIAYVKVLGMPNRFGFEYPNIRPWALTPEEEKKLRATDATVEWLCNLPRDLLYRYAGRYVAARDCQIVASGETMDAMLQELGDIDLETVVLHHIRKPGLYVL